MLSGHDCAQLGMKAVRRGASDFVVKPYHPRRAARLRGGPRDRVRPHPQPEDAALGKRVDSRL